jgi:hypothetical protein
MALLLLLGIIMPQCLLVGIDADGCWLGDEQLLCPFQCVCSLILLLWAGILRPCPDAAFAKKTTTVEHGRNIALPAPRPIGLRFKVCQTNDTLQTETMRVNVPRRPSSGQMVAFPQTGNGMFSSGTARVFCVAAGHKLPFLGI